MKRLLTAAISIILAVMLPVSTLAAGWITDEHEVKKYQKEDGQYAAGEWLTIDGKQYYFYTTGESATGWVKDGDNWYYCEESTGERRYSDLKTDVFTFKIDRKTGICSNFKDNHTPSEQAGWFPTDLGNDELVKEASLGRIVYYNGQWWTTPEAMWPALNPEVVYEHDVSSVAPADRFTISDIAVEESQLYPESLTGLW